MINSKVVGLIVVVQSVCGSFRLFRDLFGDFPGCRFQTNVRNNSVLGRHHQERYLPSLKIY